MTLAISNLLRSASFLLQAYAIHRLYMRSPSLWRLAWSFRFYDSRTALAVVLILLRILNKLEHKSRVPDLPRWMVSTSSHHNFVGLSRGFSSVSEQIIEAFSLVSRHSYFNVHGSILIGEIFLPWLGIYKMPRLKVSRRLTSPLFTYRWIFFKIIYRPLICFGGTLRCINYPWR